MEKVEWSEPYQALMVAETIHGAHPDAIDYPLLDGDILVWQSDGSWRKVYPGADTPGFVLSAEQVQSLKAVQLRDMRASFFLEGDVPVDQERPGLRGTTAGYDF